MNEIIKRLKNEKQYLCLALEQMFADIIIRQKIRSATHGQRRSHYRILGIASPKIWSSNHASELGKRDQLRPPPWSTVAALPPQPARRPLCPGRPAGGCTSDFPLRPDVPGGPVSCPCPHFSQIPPALWRAGLLLTLGRNSVLDKTRHSEGPCEPWDLCPKSIRMGSEWHRV